MLSNLTSAIQLLATLTAGFAVLGYTKYFYTILRERLFRADEEISRAVTECCQSRKVDSTTMDSLMPTKIGEGTNEDRIQELKIAYEKTEGSIAKLKSEANNSLNEKCCTRILTSICLFIFMESVLLLFVPTARSLYGLFIEYFILSFSSLCILYIFVGWLCGERDHRCILMRFESLWHPIAYSLSFVIISLVFAFICTNCFHVNFGNVWKYMFVILVLGGWLNFVSYAVIVKMAIGKFRKTLNDNKKQVVEECEKVNKIYDRIITVSEEATLASSAQ